MAGFIDRLRWSLARRLVGEMSTLRAPAVSSFFYPSYRLDSSRVNYELARALYHNTADAYKLGAGFARPIIHATAGFMGAPHFSHADPDASGILERMAAEWESAFFRVNRNALRDGDVFARIVYAPDRFNPSVRRFTLRLIPPEWVTPEVDPLTGDLMRVTIRYPMKSADGLFDWVLTEIITPKERRFEVDGRAPADVRDRLAAERPEQPWGVIPIVHFANEREEYSLWGASDLEPVEPYLKAYHDTMLHAVTGSRLFSRPKVKFKLKDVRQFLERNFSEDERRSGKVQFAGKELFLLQDDEDIEFITADPGLDGIATLLKLLFFCIVDASETPEFVFGTAVQSSKASVSEQMVPFARKIRRKRGMFAGPYAELAALYLYMQSQVPDGVRVENYSVDVGWEELSPKSSKEIAETVATLVQGLVSGLEAGLISLPSAVEFLREFVPSMLPWVDEDADDDERRRVLETWRLRARLEDGEGFEAEEDEGLPTPAGVEAA